MAKRITLKKLPWTIIEKLAGNPQPIEGEYDYREELILHVSTALGENMLLDEMVNSSYIVKILKELKEDETEVILENKDFDMLLKKAKKPRYKIICEPYLQMIDELDAAAKVDVDLNKLKKEKEAVEDRQSPLELVENS